MLYTCHFKNGLLYERYTHDDTTWPCILTQIYLFSYKNDKVNNWSQGIHTITPYRDFDHIKGKENELADSLSNLRTLGLCEANEPKKKDISMANPFSVQKQKWYIT